MVVATLQTAILDIFSAMNSMTSGGDKYCADELASAISDFISTGVVTSLDDTGVIGSNTYKGAGSGSMAIDESTLAEKLLATFTKDNTTDTEIAENIASNINDVCSAANTVSTTTIGTQTTPSGTTTPYSGSGKGTFSGTDTIISEALKTAFATMSTLTSGGNEVFATALATSINSYLIGGSISITLQSPIVGTATGKIA